MNPRTCLVVTSIASPNRVLRDLAAGAQQNNIPFFLIGDTRSPHDFQLEGCDFYSLVRQRQSDFRLAAVTPERHYARKNLGYLLAMQAGAEIIIETDDDNLPDGSFWDRRVRKITAPLISRAGWVNAYAYFTDVRIWPRGLPLDAIQNPVPRLDGSQSEPCDCPIQQGLAEDNPDVDAIYRLVLPLPVTFHRETRVAFGEGSWCPFNSQNTSWWADVFPLLYLPAYCSFRMTDIWRSFVAQRIAWANSWSILFHGPTVRQERNEHKLMADFQDEVPGYLNNRLICEALEGLTIQPGKDGICDNLRLCYETLVRMNVVGRGELELLEAWLGDIGEFKST